MGVSCESHHLWRHLILDGFWTQCEGEFAHECLTNFSGIGTGFGCKQECFSNSFNIKSHDDLIS